jgi:DNA-binding transcriptional ArsR family regulator
MPRVPDTPLPEQVHRAVEAFGSPVRVSLLHALGAVGPATSGQLAEHLGLSVPTISNNLRILERLELVHTDAPAGQRNGRRVQYRLRPETQEHLLQVLSQYLHPRAGQ